MVSMASRPVTDPSLDVASPGLVCCRCRYDLRGQPRRGKCPECGELVEISAANPPKRPPAGLALGLGLAGCISISVLLMTPLFAVPVVFSITGLWASVVALRRWRNGTRAERVMTVFGMIFSLLGIGLMAALIYGLSTMHIC